MKKTLLHVFILLFLILLFFYFIFFCVLQYAVESQICLRGFDPRESMVLLKPRAVTLYHFLDKYLHYLMLLSVHFRNDFLSITKNSPRTTFLYVHSCIKGTNTEICFLVCVRGRRHWGQRTFCLLSSERDTLLLWWCSVESSTTRVSCLIWRSSPKQARPRLDHTPAQWVML